MTERNVITVDGLASSGKTTLSRLLAEKLGYAHLNSGLLYRAVGWLALEAGIMPAEEQAFQTLLDSHTILLDESSAGNVELSVDGRVLLDELQLPRVSEATSQCAKHPLVRSFLRSAQREAFPGKPLVAEGRDMGTVIFPEAAVKFFVSVAVQERVDRRMRQLLEKTPDMGISERNDLQKQMEIEIIQRDERDSKRSVAPTVPAPDAILINNSGQTLTQVVQSMYDSVASKGLV